VEATSSEKKKNEIVEENGEKFVKIVHERDVR
jgi:hypothetical protein